MNEEETTPAPPSDEYSEFMSDMRAQLKITPLGRDSIVPYFFTDLEKRGGDKAVRNWLNVNLPRCRRKQRLQFKGEDENAALEYARAIAFQDITIHRREAISWGLHKLLGPILFIGGTREYRGYEEFIGQLEKQKAQAEKAGDAVGAAGLKDSINNAKELQDSHFWTAVIGASLTGASAYDTYRRHSRHYQAVTALRELLTPTFEDHFGLGPETGRGI